MFVVHVLCTVALILIRPNHELLNFPFVKESSSRTAWTILGIQFISFSILICLHAYLNTEDKLHEYLLAIRLKQKIEGAQPILSMVLNLLEQEFCCQKEVNQVNNIA